MDQAVDGVFLDALRSVEGKERATPGDNMLCNIYFVQGFELDKEGRRPEASGINHDGSSTS